ncbi:MAG: hypothetical protein ABSE84_02670 [Isosphaeraceae bacterium]|jgi:hypothetical protein
MQLMNIRVVLQLDNMPDDAALHSVTDILRAQVCEWLGFDTHPADVHVLTVEKTDET